jgi:hypothetical protein
MEMGNDHDYIEKNYQESVKRNRQELVRGWFGSPPSGPESKGARIAYMIFGGLMAAAVGVGLCLSHPKFPIIGRNDEPVTHIEPGNSPPALTPPASVVPLRKPDPEIISKYNGALAEKRKSLISENDRLLGDYGRFCSNPATKSQRVRCEQIDAKHSANNKWLDKNK